jgi:hypothetical protein
MRQISSQELINKMKKLGFKSVSRLRHYDSTNLRCKNSKRENLSRKRAKVCVKVLQGHESLNGQFEGVK